MNSQKTPEEIAAEVIAEWWNTPSTLQAIIGKAITAERLASDARVEAARVLCLKIAQGYAAPENAGGMRDKFNTLGKIDHLEWFIKKAKEEAREAAKADADQRVAAAEVAMREKLIQIVKTHYYIDSPLLYEMENLPASHPQALAKVRLEEAEWWHHKTDECMDDDCGACHRLAQLRREAGEES